MSMFDRLLRRVWLLGVPLGIAAAAVVIAIARPWHHGDRAGDSMRVQQATLRPGQIVLVLVNESGDIARVAQVILNDAFVDFRQTQHELKPGDAERITVSYPWVRGESYDVELMTSTGSTVQYDIEEAEVGTQSAEAA